MSESVVNENCLDKAFATMIEQSASILSLGRPMKRFEELLPKPEPLARFECDFDLVVPVEKEAGEISTEKFNVYHPLVEELKRFEPQVTMITALEPGQGVTYTAHHIARLWSDDPLKKTLLLELYNGMSGLDYYLPQVEARALAADSQKLEGCLRYSDVADLYLLSLHSAGGAGFTGEVFSRIKASFETVIIDCGPYWHNSLASKLAPLSDGVVLISSHKPDTDLVRRFNDELVGNDARFMGVLMNAQ